MSNDKIPGLTVIELVPERLGDGKAAMLANLDDLRAKVDSGEIVAWAGVGITASDETYHWQASAGGVTNLRLVGAVTRLLYGVHQDIDAA